MLRNAFSSLMYVRYSVMQYKYRVEIYVNLSGIDECMRGVWAYP